MDKCFSALKCHLIILCIIFAAYNILLDHAHIKVDLKCVFYIFQPHDIGNFQKAFSEDRSWPINSETSCIATVSAECVTEIVEKAPKLKLLRCSLPEAVHQQCKALRPSLTICDDASRSFSSISPLWQ